MQLFATPWTVAHQAPLSMEYSRNIGVGCHSLLQGIFPGPGFKLLSPVGQADSLPSEPPGKYCITLLMTHLFPVLHCVKFYIGCLKWVIVNLWTWPKLINVTNQDFFLRELLFFFFSIYHHALM